MQHVLQQAAVRGFITRTKKSDKTKVVTTCFVTECTFRIRATWKEDEGGHGGGNYSQPVSRSSGAKAEEHLAAEIPGDRTGSRHDPSTP